MKPLIAPSLLSSDFLHLERDIEMINRSEADWFHLDIMDGVFVPNISFGFPVIDKIRQKAAKPLDVHLMIIEPDRYIARFAESGASVISVHYEACIHLHRTLFAIRQSGAKAGIVLNPHTPVSLLQDVIRDVDLVLIMSVNPGFGGQKFIERTYTKIRELKKMITGQGSAALIEIDGGVDLQNAKLLVDCGADVLVAGNSVFSSPDPQKVIRQLKALE
jgi:ribulose-phosphate 3-epimerase